MKAITVTILNILLVLGIFIIKFLAVGLLAVSLYLPFEYIFLTQDILTEHWAYSTGYLGGDVLFLIGSLIILKKKVYQIK